MMDTLLLADVLMIQKRRIQKVRLGPSALLDNAGLFMGRASKDDKDKARAANRLRHAHVHREEYEGRNINSRRKAVRKGKQPTTEQLRPKSGIQLHNVSGREQLVRLGNESVLASRRLQVDEDGGLGPEKVREPDKGMKARPKEGLHPRGKAGVPTRAP